MIQAGLAEILNNHNFYFMLYVWAEKKVLWIEPDGDDFEIISI
jgi:hypothetical protein